MQHALHFLIQHGYALVFFWLLLEQAALPIPSLPLLLACGALSRSGQLSLPRVILYGTAACLIADNMWFQLGRLRGGKIVRFVCRVSLEPDSCVRQTEDAFLKYGLRSLLVSKFVPGLNAVAAPLAGSSGARLSRFLLFDTPGVLIWLSTYLLIGYLFSDQLEDVLAYATRMGSGLGVAVVALLAAWILWKWVQRRRFLQTLVVARITAEELRDRLKAGENVVVVDVRSRLSQDGESIPGAIQITTEELSVRYQEIPRDREVVLFCS